MMCSEHFLPMPLRKERESDAAYWFIGLRIITHWKNVTWIIWTTSRRGEDATGLVVCEVTFPPKPSGHVFVKVLRVFCLLIVYLYLCFIYWWFMNVIWFKERPSLVSALYTHRFSPMSSGISCLRESFGSAKRKIKSLLIVECSWALRRNLPE